MFITKNAVLITVVSASLCACMLSGCEMNPSGEDSASGEPLKSLTAPEVSVSPSWEGFDLSWKAVEGAEFYTVYWTWNDYPISTFASDAAHVYSVTVSEPAFSHRYRLPENRVGYLDFALSKYSADKFKYLVTASAPGYASSRSRVSEDNMVDPVLTVHMLFEGYSNADIIALFLRVPYDQSSDTVDGWAEQVTIFSGETDSEGKAYLKAIVDREHYYGVAMIKDIDGSESLTDGDIVVGSEGGNSIYSYSYWTSLVTESSEKSLTWSADRVSSSFIYGQ